MKIRVGMEGGRKPVLAAALKLGAPILVSANSLWNGKTFSGWYCYTVTRRIHVQLVFAPD